MRSGRCRSLPQREDTCWCSCTATAATSAGSSSGYTRYLPPFQSVGLLGVSQGAVLALHLLRLEPARFSYALNLSGYVLAGEEVGDAELRQRRPPVFWGRGEYDCVIPSSYVERTEKWLPLHSTVTANVYPVGHEESAPELADAAAFVRQMTRSRLHRSSNRSG